MHGQDLHRHRLKPRNRPRDCPPPHQLLRRARHPRRAKPRRRGRKPERTSKPRRAAVAYSTPWHLDLASFASVQAFAAKATAQLGRIDALVENAGVIPGQVRARAEGMETYVTVNVVGTVLLPRVADDAEAEGRCAAVRYQATIDIRCQHAWFCGERRAEEERGCEHIRWDE